MPPEDRLDRPPQVPVRHRAVRPDPVDRWGPAALRGAAREPAADDRGDPLAASEPGQVAEHPGRTRPLVGSGHCHERRRLAEQTFIRWAELGVWERLLELAQRRGLAL